MSESWRATAILIGTTVGAGMFGLPFAVAKVGFLPGMIYLFSLGTITLLVNLAYAEVALRTPGDHQLGGYIYAYLGKRKGLIKLLSTLSLFVSIYGALLAYLIQIGEFLAIVFGGGNPLIYSIAFFLFACFAIFWGLRSISFLETGLVFLLILMVLFLSFSGWSKIEPTNLSYLDLSPKNLFLPYGVILFALAGSSVVPEMEEVLRKKPHQLKNSVIAGTLIPLFIYFLFSLLVVGICGISTSVDSIESLLPFFPIGLVKMGALLGILTMGSSFFALAYVLREIWHRDFSFPKISAFVFACLPPLFLFLAGAREFIRVIEFSGAVSGGLIGILILKMFQEAKKKGKRKPAFLFNLPLPLIWFLYLVFFLGLFSPLLS